jgi:hypothetical protein
MTRGVGIDPPAARRFQQPTAQGEHGRVRPPWFLHMKVQVELLRMGGIRPPRGDVAVDGLERQYRARGRVESRPAIADRPPRIRMIDAAAKQRAIEFRELSRIRAVQHHAFQGREWLSPLRRRHGDQSCRTAVSGADGRLQAAGQERAHRGFHMDH